MNKKLINTLYSTHRNCEKCPSPELVCTFFEKLLGTFFPEHSKSKYESEGEFTLHLDGLKVQFEQILSRNTSNIEGDPHVVIARFFTTIEEIYNKLQEDVKALYEGDPAADSENEIVRSYPGFYATAAYRIAHEMYKLNVRVIPRIITEFAHSKTGIDIHPAAEIGRHFFIDHGTGVVIGETTKIGDHVKLYQGVTLGALSVSKGDYLKKRHPTIEDNVIIYSGATILGGNTVIGHDSIIGGNVWLTKSVPPNSKIYYKSIMDGDSQVSKLISVDS